jgi:hypothetical protein
MQEPTPHSGAEDNNEQEKVPVVFDFPKDCISADQQLPEILKIEDSTTVRAEELFQENLIKCEQDNLHYIEKMSLSASEIEDEIEEEKEKEEGEEGEEGEEKDKKEKKKTAAQQILEWYKEKKVIKNQIKKTQSIVLSSNGNIAFIAAEGNPNIFCYKLDSEELICNFNINSIFLIFR